MPGRPSTSPAPPSIQRLIPGPDGIGLGLGESAGPATSTPMGAATNNANGSFSFTNTPDRTAARRSYRARLPQGETNVERLDCGQIRAERVMGAVVLHRGSKARNGRLRPQIAPTHRGVPSTRRPPLTLQTVTTFTGSRLFLQCPDIFCSSCSRRSRGMAALFDQTPTPSRRPVPSPPRRLPFLKMTAPSPSITVWSQPGSRKIPALSFRSDTAARN